jgi:hypothetical protein
MLDGELTETKFDWPKNENEAMIEKDKQIYKKDQVSYINGRLISNLLCYPLLNSII